MGSLEGNVEDLSRAILTEAREETEQLKTDARARAATIRQRAQAEADSERRSILDQATREADRLRSQALATAQLKARAMELERRERMLDKVFSAVSQKLSTVVHRKDYQELAANLVREGLTQLRTDRAEIRADQATLKVLTKNILAEISKAMHTEISIGEPLESGIGVVIQAAEGHLHFDNTLETRLTRIQGAVRAEVYQVLTGETA
jgi:vacuolar-type H+-ATPase subunit E/Vma4